MYLQGTGMHVGPLSEVGRSTLPGIKSWAALRLFQGDRRTQLGTASTRLNWSSLLHKCTSLLGTGNRIGCPSHGGSSTQRHMLCQAEVIHAGCRQHQLDKADIAAHVSDLIDQKTFQLGTKLGYLSQLCKMPLGGRQGRQPQSFAQQGVDMCQMGKGV